MLATRINRHTRARPSLGHPKRSKLSLLALLPIAAGLLPDTLSAQSDEPSSIAQRMDYGDAPRAAWITAPGLDPHATAVLHFRRVLALDRVPAEFIVHVSGDNRYRLYLNGREISSGPQRSDVLHWRFETVDLAPWLQQGENVLAATVWNWGDYLPVGQISLKTGFLLQGKTDAEAVANTPNDWRVFENSAYSFEEPRDVDRYYASIPEERLDARSYPWGWKLKGFDDRAWPLAQGYGHRRAASELRGENWTGVAEQWQLMPRSIPPMRQVFAPLGQTRRASHSRLAKSLDSEGRVTIPANTEATFLIDHGVMAKGFVLFQAHGGRGAEIQAQYAESLYGPPIQGRRWRIDRNKGDRDSIEGKRMRGLTDTFILDGGDNRQFKTLWYRAFRYVEVRVKTKGEPAEISGLGYESYDYPFAERGRISTDAPWTDPLWEICIRSLVTGSFETFTDTPYYEQMQYLGDSRLSALIGLYLSGDDRLMRQAIDHFHYSREGSGLTQGRYPSHLTQYLPTYSLVWIDMLRDYWMHRPDQDYVRELLPGVAPILAWFEQRLRPDGLLGPIDWWPYIDVSPEWRGGRPPQARSGGSVAVTMQFAYTLKQAADLYSAFGYEVEAERASALQRQLIAAMVEAAWDEEAQLFRDTAGGGFSQQTNSLAVLADTTPIDKVTVVRRMLDTDDINPASYYFSFYLFEAMREAGLGDLYIDQLGPWREMLERGMTTTPEHPEPTRSDNHSWSAHPAYGLLATVLGARPASPGFATVAIEPHLGPLQRAAGAVPIPAGDIRVALARQGDEGIEADITLPPGISGVFTWKGQSLPLSPGANSLTLP